VTPEEIRDAIIAVGEANHYDVAVAIANQHGGNLCPSCGESMSEKTYIGYWDEWGIKVCAHCAARGVFNAQFDKQMRWLGAATEAAHRQGLRLVEADGVEDYQGWGTLLLRGNGRWAVLNWFYGSCSGCDSYEGMDDLDRLGALTDLIEYYDDEETARCRLQKGWSPVDLMTYVDRHPWWTLVYLFLVCTTIVIAIDNWRRP
jgi:hypothetical protein